MTKSKPLPPLALLREVLIYDPATGVFTWRKQIGSRAPAGGVVGNIANTGYREARVLRMRVLLHRVAWVFISGNDPGDKQIDHINGVRSDNRADNLRLATNGENKCNARLLRTNTSGIKGVSWHKGGQKWMASIYAEEKYYYLGLFEDKKEAARVVAKAREQLHKDFANHGEA